MQEALNTTGSRKASPSGTPGENGADGRFELPGGIVDGDGRCHKIVRVRELTGADEEVLSDRRYRNGARQVTDLLARVIVQVDGLERAVDRDLVADMLIGDRDYLVLRLRQLTQGDRVHQVMRCPNTVCGEKVDVEFLISEIPVKRVDAVQQSYEFTLSRPALPGDESSDGGLLRLPNGRDQEAVAELGDLNPAQSNTRLFSRVLLRLGRTSRLEEEVVRQLPLKVRQEIGEFLREMSAGPDFGIDVGCPYCGADLAYPFDLHGFFLTSGR